jgi:3-deoxy-D-manno-octulosonic-acid transferase
MQQELKNIGVCYYLPLDLIGPLESFIKKINPKICIIFETEIWGNLSAVLYRQNIKYIYINGRLSKKTIDANFIIKQSYQYSLKNCHYIFCRNDEDLENFIKLGSDKNNTKVIGNLKYGFVAKKNNMTKVNFNKPVIAFISTHKDEELQLGNIWQQNPDLHKYLLLIAPRYPHRANSIHTQLNNLNLNIKTRSKNEKIAENTHIYLADTLGELSTWFYYAKIIIIGGSFITSRGGQSFTEAASFNKPIICGPYMANFTEDVKFFKSQNAIIQCQDITDIPSIIHNYEQDNKTFKKIGQNAYKIMQDNRHIIDEYYQAIKLIC